MLKQLVKVLSKMQVLGAVRVGMDGILIGGGLNIKRQPIWSKFG